MKRILMALAAIPLLALAQGEKAPKAEKTSEELAHEVRKMAPWKRQITDELFNEYILPDTVIDEEKDDWRPMFKKIFFPVVKGARTPTEAVRKINAVIWDKLDVHYSMERDFPNQSPFHSMRIHKASCTGQTILQVCAYRTVGVPARLVTCNWTTRQGNHTWAEYWDKGWHVSGEDGKSKIDDRWSAILAAEADVNDPSKHIYASRATPNGTWLWRTWGMPNVPMVGLVPADDVTERYKKYKDMKITVKKTVRQSTVGRPRVIKTGETIYSSPEASRRGYFVPSGRSKLLRAF